jgi:hypothetical protein
MADSRPPAMFIVDSLGLDFLNSIATQVDKPIEFIGSGTFNFTFTIWPK